MHAVMPYIIHSRVFPGHYVSDNLRAPFSFPPPYCVDAHDREMNTNEGQNRRRDPQDTHIYQGRPQAAWSCAVSAGVLGTSLPGASSDDASSPADPALQMKPPTLCWKPHEIQTATSTNMAAAKPDRVYLPSQADS